MTTQAQFFKALGDARRLSIAGALLEGELDAGHLAAVAGRDSSTVSRHLQVLVEAGILRRRRDGRQRGSSSSASLSPGLGLTDFVACKCFEGFSSNSSANVLALDSESAFLQKITDFLGMSLAPAGIIWGLLAAVLCIFRKIQEITKSRKSRYLPKIPGNPQK